MADIIGDKEGYSNEEFGSYGVNEAIDFPGRAGSILRFL
jgi:hypothetical protein